MGAVGTPLVLQHFTLISAADQSRRSLGGGIAACHVAFARRDAPVMPHRNAMHRTAPHRTALQCNCAALRCTAPHRTAAMHGTALRCAATPLHCSGTNITSSERIGAGNAGLHIIFFSNCAKLPVSFEVRSLATRARTRTHACAHCACLAANRCARISVRVRVCGRVRDALARVRA